MKSRKTILTALLALAMLFPATAESPAQVITPSPVFKLIGVHLPTHLPPGAKGEILLIAANIGGGAAEGSPVTITDTLPSGIEPLDVTPHHDDPDSPAAGCEPIVGQTVTCTVAGPVKSGRQFQVSILVEASALIAEGEHPHEATVSGGGAAPVSTEMITTISDAIAPFGFLPRREGGPDAPLTEADGSPVTAAGSHPYQYTASLGFPTKEPEDFLIGSGTVRDVTVDLPRGLIVNPTATPVLCTEAQLITQTPGCPAASQVGQISAITVGVFPESDAVPLFNMVPPPGEAASLGFDVFGIGVHVHVSGSVRSDGDFGLSGTTEDALALPFHPVFGARVELWGDPSSELHDHVRGQCSTLAPPPKDCSEPVEAQEAAFVSLPGECSGEPLLTGFRANTWQNRESFIEGSYQSADLDGNPVQVDGCNALQFEPKITAQPTTNLADSPSGFEFNLHQPQDFDLDGLATAVLKDATVTLPPGLVVNPSAGEGQEACGPAAIGLMSGVGQTPVRFSKVPDSCPEAAKIGTIEVRTPLLAELDESETVIQRDPEGNPIPRPLLGEVFLAEPFRNPFGSLLAIYFSVEDPKSGTVAKFATKVSADPATGQLTNTLTESPQLPLEDVSLSIFAGPRAALRTPPACAPYTTTTNMVPWSAPEGPGASPTDSFAITASPHSGGCPASAETAPHQPAFVAGTLSPQAGSYSPFVLRLSREDATQPIGGFEATLPPGLSAKLVGVATCTEAQIARAKAREAPELGRLEQADPSCPAASEVGGVDVAAGAGPTPLHTSGRVYLAGPYKGAPLSVVIITPAVAGPFDLGAVVVRSALYVDPRTAQVRAVSDPLPTILEGIPLDLRSAALRMGRPQFTLNPTSCDPFAVNALATSVFGQGAALTSPFQVGGCRALPFKPKLALRLRGGTKRGGHPRLQAILSARPGDANIAAATISLPRSQFVDQAHIRTVCTRVQFAAKGCPKGAIYGHVKATTPLLEEVLEGPVYLRSSDNELPDAVAVLKGPPSRPIEIEGVARIDSVPGRGVRVNIDTVPDAPIGKVVVRMQGGAKGLLINSRNLCARAYRAIVRMRGQNGKTHNFRPALRNDCRKGKKGGKRGKGGAKRGR